MQAFLDAFSQQYSQYKNIILVDCAGWHLTKKLVPIDNIRFIPLPPGSPELNPTEHLWEHIREKHIGNKTFPSLDAVENEMVDILNGLTSEIAEIKKLVGFHWLTGLTTC